MPSVEHDGVIVTNDYKELEGIHFVNHLKERYGLPAIIENEERVVVYGRRTSRFSRKIN